MKKKSARQERNIYVKLALFRKAGSHKKSNKAIRRLEKSKKNYYSEAHISTVRLLPYMLPLAAGMCASL